MNTEHRTPNYNIRATGGSVKRSLAMAIPKAFGFEAATQQITRAEQRATSGGFTLAEAIMATVVLSIAAAGVLLPFTSGARVRAEGVRRTLAAKLASDLMEEIINTKFEDIKATYPEEIFTDPMYVNFSRGASSVNVDVPVSLGRYSKDVEFILVTVWVKYNGCEIVNVKRLISK